MADRDPDSSAADGSRKRRKLDTKIPSMVELVTTEAINANDLNESQRAGAAANNQILRDTENLIIVSLLNRGCRRYALSNSKIIYSVEQDYYVGIEGTEFSPVYLRYSGAASLYASVRPANDATNDYSRALFGVGNTKKTGHFVIPPVDMLRPRQMMFLKKLKDIGRSYTRENFTAEFRKVLDNELEAYAYEQTSDFCKGRASSVLIHDPDLQLDYNSIPATSPSTWEGFQMRVPKVNNPIPAPFVEEIASFLTKYPHDMLELAFAVSMALVWCRLSSTPGFQPELCTIKPGTDPEEGQARRAVPQPSLAVFLLYAPHFFRFHEEHRLGVYGHIFRYACSLYPKDAAFNEDFHVSSKHINQKKILEMFSKLGPEDLEWVEIVPPSFDGTQIPMPLNQGRRALRSQKTTASLLLPDVYTLGLPDYQNETRKDCGLVMRKVIVHKSWATPAMLSEPSVKKYSGPMRLAEKKLQRYKTKGGLQLWTTPKKIVRAPWRGVNVPFINNVADEANRRPTTAPERGIDQRQTGRLESSAVSREAVIEFSQKLVMQFRKARENGLIAPSVRFGDNGLTWDGMQESDKFTKRLPSGISIDDMVSVDAALQADLLSKEDRSLLQKLLTNLDHAHGVPRRVKLFASTLDQSDPGLTKTKTAALMEEMGGQISSAMSCLAENGDGQQRGMDTLTEHIIKPCCVLLDLEYPGSHSEGHRAIVQADFEVGMAISDIMYQAMLPGPGGLREAIQKLKRSKKFMPIWSFLLLKDNFKGIVFDEEHRALWALVFGEPYGVGTQTE